MKPTITNNTETCIPTNLQLQPTAAAKVVCTLVSLLFAVPGLDWSVDLGHVEVFCGKGEVTLGELQEWGCRFGWFGGLQNNIRPYDPICIL